jgi:hypothetical protein
VPCVVTPVVRHDCRSDYPPLVERLRSVAGEKLRSAAIAERVNAEGVRAPPPGPGSHRGDRASAAGLLGPSPGCYGCQAGLAGNVFRPTSLARRLGESRRRAHHWLRSGYLSVRKDEDGYAIIRADASERRRLRELARQPRTEASQAAVEASRGRVRLSNRWQRGRDACRRVMVGAGTGCRITRLDTSSGKMGFLVVRCT